MPIGDISQSIARHAFLIFGSPRRLLVPEPKPCLLSTEDGGMNDVQGKFEEGFEHRAWAQFGIPQARGADVAQHVVLLETRTATTSYLPPHIYLSDL